MKDNFERALAVVLEFEGGFVNHPRDPGGATNKGITLATYRRYKRNATVADLKRIPKSMVRRIYRDGYWNKVKADDLAAGVDLVTFDYGVNSGPSAARRSLMKSIGNQPDYVTVQKLCRRRLSIYRTFKHWSSFGRGWTRRINTVEAKGVAWAKDGGAAVLKRESGKADRLSKDQAKGAGGTGAGGGAGAFTLPAEVLVPLLIAAGLLIAFLVWRSAMNKERAKAYRQEVNDYQEA